jgi:hypothetical protein
MRIALLVAGLAVSGCSETAPQAAPAVKPAFGKAGGKSACADQFSQTDCRAHPGCRWVNAYKRGDGTYATPYCDGQARSWWTVPVK